MWLLESGAYHRLAKAYGATSQISTEQQTEFAAVALSAAADGSRISTIAGTTAEIAVSGVLTKSPDFFARIFEGGNTTYAEIIAALATAQADPNIKNVVLNVDSPGGTVDGLFDTLAALQAFSKPMTARVSNLAASAAFAIVAQADSIEATNPMARFGSVGVAADFFVSENRVSITSTDAPNKRPNVTTEEGKAIVREELDALHEVFAEAIASGRDTTVEKVNEKFGRGATVVAAEAKKQGMIDRVAKTSLKSVPTKTKTKAKHNPEATHMDLATLRAEHPDVYTAAIAQERDRVNAFLVAGEASGDMKTALEAIRSDTEMTVTLNTTFMMAAANRGDLDKRADDDKTVVTTGADEGANEDSEADQVLAVVQKRMGVAQE